MTIDTVSEGDEFSFEQVVAAAHIDAFAALSGDVSPLHVDPVFAVSRGFPDRVAHGALLSGYASRLFGVHLPGRDCLLQSLSMRYLQPVHPGDRLTVSARISQVSPAMKTFAAEIAIIRASVVVAKGKAQVGFTGDSK
ncbi:MAG: MaoC family dehydratase N-terminal domain-containing protein [Rhodospirillaceae bacterium]|nr:MaoC family dehydratase N-terminal domain-containing protein [Rhodospirillales bacterium]